MSTECVMNRPIMLFVNDLVYSASLADVSLQVTVQNIFHIGTAASDTPDCESSKMQGFILRLKGNISV